MVEITYPCRRLSDLPAEWGQVIQTPVGQATFRSDSFSYWDGIAPLAIQGEAGIGWFDLQRRPFRGSEVERHRFTPEALLCFRGAAACVVGNPVDPGSIDPKGLGVFYVEQGNGFVFPPGTWHALPFPLTEKAVFWVIFRKDTAQKDLEVLDLEKERGFAFQISLEGFIRNEDCCFQQEKG